MLPRLKALVSAELYDVLKDPKVTQSVRSLLGELEFALGGRLFGFTFKLSNT
jgi:hypothetical protein